MHTYQFIIQLIVAAWWRKECVSICDEQVEYIYNLKRTIFPSWYWTIFDFFFLDIWLAVHHSITFLLLPTWYTNFLFIHTNYIKLNSSTCFKRNSLIIRRSTMQIVHMQPLVSSLSASDHLVQPLSPESSPSLTAAQDGHLQRVTIPEAAYVQFASTSWWWADCARNM
jgi:hypothetical protein